MFSGCHMARLHCERFVNKAVDRLDTACNVTFGRGSKPERQIDRYEAGKPEKRQNAKMQPPRHHAKQAKPAEAEKQADQKYQRQDERPEPLEAD